jgi:hypothetical protein
MRIILLAIAIVISLGLCFAGAGEINSHEAEATNAAAMIGKSTTITVGWPGCQSEDVFNKLNSIAESGDTTAFLKFSFDNRATGECMVLPEGLKVKVEKASQQHVCVRPEGRKAIAELKRQAAETAKHVADVEANALIRGEITVPEMAERAERWHKEIVERGDLD